MPVYKNMTKAELVRYALKKGRVRLPDSTPSELLPSFREALVMATVDELQKALAYFVANPQTRYTHRKQRMSAIGDELLRRMRAGEDSNDER